MSDENKSIEAQPAEAVVSEPKPAERAPGEQHQRERTPYRGRGDGEDREKGGYRSDGQRLPKFKRKVCRFCHEKSAVIDYKNADMLERFITDRGKILPRRVTGTCAKHQRSLAKVIKMARTIALIPFLEK